MGQRFEGIVGDMKIRAAILLSLLAGCTVDDAGLELVLRTTPPFQADGQSAIEVEVCNTAPEPASKVTVLLSATQGKWLRAPSDKPRDLTIDLSPVAPCVIERWIPTTAPGAVRFEAKVGDAVLARVDSETTAAKIVAIAILADPVVLSSESNSSVTIRADLTTENGGKPSDGTRVQVRLAETDPIGAASIGDGPIVLGTKDSLTLSAAKGTRAVKLIATVQSDGEVLEACRVLRPLGQTSTTSMVLCP